MEEAGAALNQKWRRNMALLAVLFTAIPVMMDMQAAMFIPKALSKMNMVCSVAV